MRGVDLPDEDVWRLVAYIEKLRGNQLDLSETASISLPPPPHPVSYEDLLHAAEMPDRWLTYSGSYSGQRFSAADQISPANAAQLRLVWSRPYAVPERIIETTPLVVGNYMFVTVPPNRVQALDARAGALIWEYQRDMPENPPRVCCGYVNRGLAVLGNLLFYGTIDAHLVALDMRSGEVKWDIEVADYRAGYSITGAPLALKDKVITGVAGGEFGIRGFLDAYDAESGRRVWRFHTIPGPGQPGSESWAGDSWKTGGTPTWMTGSYDPELNLLYWPTGNPGPVLNGASRKGDNLYSNSMLALDPDRGTLKWYFQFTPHDEHDYDANAIPVLMNGVVNGQERRFLAQANKNAFYYLLDRENGQFRLARPFAKQTWAERIDDAGRPVIIPTSRPTPKGTIVRPSSAGAANWQSPSYSPLTRSIYISVMEMGEIYFTGEDEVEYSAGDFSVGSTYQRLVGPVQVAIRSLNALTGELQWEFEMTTDTRNIPTGEEVSEYFNRGGVLSTAGGVVFGGLGEWFVALDANTGRELWRVNTGGEIKAAPITFISEGRQLVTVAAGRNILTFGLEGTLTLHQLSSE
jgi:alcohol dehydrogenase (cytochrome c)